MPRITFNSVECLRIALVRAEQAHADYERTVLGGRRDSDWAGWYARYIAVEHLEDMPLSGAGTQT
jgi:hypothetical protein